MSLFRGTYILAGIDGTGSHEWRREDGSNSRVYLFVSELDAQGGAKDYWNGPGALFGGEIFGAGATARVETVAQWVNKEVRAHLPFDRRLYFPYLQQPARVKHQLRARYKDQIRIVLTGHSRGGLIAICVARKLCLPVYFMALYDAVDMHPTLEADLIDNTDHVAHAIRSAELGSRESWGNCGLRTAGIFPIEQKEFYTSHGGIGGDPVLDVAASDPDFISLPDYTCDRTTLRASIERTLGYDKGMRCVHESTAADLFIRDRARHWGLKFH